LKSRFGAGYQLEIRCVEGRAADIVHYLSEAVQDISLEEEHGTFLRFKGPSDMDLERAFRALEVNKTRLGIDDYSISQSTLEQVFIKFAKEQEEEKGYTVENHFADVKPGEGA
jgi:hypothetical protein